ncbi:MAG: hypothetical protein PHD70_14340 [Anaerostipes sp.]|nr:hypothetical protein [Anaerostipes sp.]MDD3747637.1 hypothetical protein [Anaerostipes sp.]MDD4371117.1 hypothetical protein [Anaerostipes sp.]
MTKVYVDVTVKMTKDGLMRPVELLWEDGQKYTIDQVKKVERCASRKAGGVGIRYTCIVEGQESHLFFEVDKWFVERKSEVANI